MRRRGPTCSAGSVVRTVSIWENGQKARWRRDAHLVSALHRPFDLAFHRKTGVERVFELPLGRGAARQLPGERQPSLGRHHHRLDAVADGDLESAVVVLQFGDLDHGLALAADVDERHLRADRDDRALDGLALLEALRLERRLEHRGEIFIGLAHGTLLVVGGDYTGLSDTGVILSDGRSVRFAALRAGSGA